MESAGQSTLFPGRSIKIVLSKKAIFPMAFFSIFYDFFDLFKYVRYGGAAIDIYRFALLLIIFQYRSGLFAINAKAADDRLPVIVGASGSLAAK